MDELRAAEGKVRIIVFLVFGSVRGDSLLEPVLEGLEVGEEGILLPVVEIGP